MLIKCYNQGNVLIARDIAVNNIGKSLPLGSLNPGENTSTANNNNLKNNEI